MSAEVTNLAATSQAVELPECLLLIACPNCGYSLEGLGKEGTCPECGRDYAPKEIILYGYGRGTHENVRTAKPSRVRWVWFMTALLLFGQWQMWFSHLSRYGLLTLAALVVLPPAFLYFRRSESTHPAPVQVRISPNGCVQYDDLGVVSVVMTLFYGHNWVLWLGIALLVLSGVAIPGMPQWGLWLIALPFLFLTVVAWVIGRKYRRRVREAQENGVADFQSASNPVTPWDKVLDFEMIRHADRNSHEMLVTGRFGVEIIRAELNCTAEQAEAVIDTVKPWWRASRVLGVNTKNPQGPRIVEKAK